MTHTLVGVGLSLSSWVGTVRNVSSRLTWSTYDFGVWIGH